MRTRARSDAAEADAAPPRPLGAVLDFMSALWALDHALQSASKRMEARLEVTAPQRLVVRILGRYPGLSPGEVAGILHLHPSTLTGILKRLADHGLVERRVDPRDARRARLQLTAKGRVLDAVRTGTVEASVRRALAQLPAPDVAIAREVARALTAELSRLG
jgi:DNA-binding MarR family transcriptional regulator